MATRINKDFPRILTLLREERGLSQKQAAADLEISQPLLSHYEKGLRECGLDFVVRVADYYDVSCDYLLGRTADRKPGQVVITETSGDPKDGISTPAHRGSMINALHKKLISDSLTIIFDLLERIDNRGLTTECALYFSTGIYLIFRLLYSSNPKNTQNMFATAQHLYQSRAHALQIMSESNMENIAGGLPVAEYRSVERTKRPILSPESIAEEYPAESSSLFNLIQNTEHIIGKFNVPK